MRKKCYNSGIKKNKQVYSRFYIKVSFVRYKDFTTTKTMVALSTTFLNFTYRVNYSYALSISQPNVYYLKGLYCNKRSSTYSLWGIWKLMFFINIFTIFLKEEKSLSLFSIKQYTAVLNRSWILFYFSLNFTDLFLIYLKCWFSSVNLLFQFSSLNKISV